MWQLANKILSGRLLLGTAQFPSLQIMEAAIVASQTEVITVSIKRPWAHGAPDDCFWTNIKKLNCHLLPNTAGCHNAEDAIKMAEVARCLFQTDWIKLEVIGDDYHLQPDPFELLKAALVLNEKGFQVFPYCTDDLVLCQRLVEAGCRILMPGAAPIGSGRGLINQYALSLLRHRFPDITLIIDAGIGKPSHAAAAMELGFDGVLLNSAVALAEDPVLMATAFRDAVIAGHAGSQAGLVPERDSARASTSLIDTPFWLQKCVP